MEWPRLDSLLKTFRSTLGGALTVTTKITLWYLVLSLTPILAIGILAYRNSRASLESEILNKLHAVADNKTYILQSWLKDQLADARSLAANTSIRDLLSPTFRVVYPNLAARNEEQRIRRAKGIITALQESSPAYVDVLIVDLQGKVVSSSSPILNQQGRSLSQVGFVKLKSDQPFVSPVFYSQIAQLHVLLISSPVHDNNANVVGHAVLEVDLRPIQRLTEERSGLGNTGEVILVDRDLRMLSQSRFSEESTILKTLPDHAPWRMAIQGKEGEAAYRDYRGVPVISAFRPLPEMGAALVAKIDEPEGFSPITQLRNTVLAIIGLTMALATWVSLWAARVTARPILQAEALQKLKADFTAMIVHDLRSPLTAILSVAALMEDGAEGPVTQQQKTWLVTIQNTVRKLVDLVNNSLDLSKIEAGRLDLVKKDVDLGQLIQNSLDQHQILAQNKRISLRSRIASDLPQIRADPRRLDQVLSNLISNAVKFTHPAGEVEVGAARESQTEAKVWVKDNGVGIPEGEIGHLFELYHQTTSGQSSEQKGTGLGLMICKMIVETHGGRIWAESQESKGTTFFFSLPLHA